MATLWHIGACPADNVPVRSQLLVASAMVGFYHTIAPSLRANQAGSDVFGAPLMIGSSRWACLRAAATKHPLGERRRSSCVVSCP